jgi:hypothetical protein
VDVELSAWCRTHLGSAPATVFFEASSMSRVRGVLLADGRRVAVKQRDASDRVLACAAAHRAAAAAGIDCPALLVAPVRLGPGTWVTAEEWRDDGSPEPPPRAAERYADLLRRLVVSLDGAEPDRFAPPPPWAWYDHDAPGRVWPPAASPRWDPHREGVVPDELMRLAAAARERLVAERLPVVVGHSDLNGLNVRWTPDATPIVHDWDSLAARPECVLAGILAVNHVELPGAGAIASLDRTAEVLEHYEARRPFSDVERELAWAAGVAVAAYNAAFEYLHGQPGDVARRIASDGGERLRRAGC